MQNKYYAQFYEVKLDGKLGDVLGSGGFIYLDGRHSARRMDAIAKDEAKKRGFAAVQVRYGTFQHVLRSSWVHDVRKLTDLQTVAARMNAKG